MEFRQLGEAERKLLLKALDIDIDDLSCQNCGESVKYNACSIMPPIKTKSLATILCGNALCISEYLTDIENEKEELEELKKQPCHDCGVKEGEVHKLGCDVEKCPFCNRQNITCGCCYDLLGLVDKKKYTKTEGLSPEVYNEGLSEEQEEKWSKLLEEKGRIPFSIKNKS